MLIVDDDATFCRVLARAMEGRGYVVTVAHDVPQAIASAEHNPPRYAVVDLKMPGPPGSRWCGGCESSTRTRVLSY